MKLILLLALSVASHLVVTGIHWPSAGLQQSSSSCTSKSFRRWWRRRHIMRRRASCDRAQSKQGVIPLANHGSKEIR
jgi:hypothetical protein